VRALGGYSLSIIFETMLRNPETYFRGAPDLLFWKISVGADMHLPTSFTRPFNGECTNTRSHHDASSMIEFPRSKSAFAVEVKSANDKLSAWQTLWVELLVKAKIHVEVFKVKA
jgi:hypothetical protein